MKTVLITGVNRGIGYALAQHFLNNNWFVIGTTRKNNVPKDLKNNDNFQYEYLDLLDFDSIKSLSTRIENQAIDVLINNAGIFDSKSLSDDIKLDATNISKVFLTNTVAPYILSKFLIQNIRMGNEKLIVSVSSIVGTYENIQNYHATHWVYGSSKAALNYAMNVFSITFPDVKISLVRPGWVKTDMGGENAQLSPKESAKIIYLNIKNHKEKLPHLKMVGPDGDIISFK